jgi:hypothetical protein
MSGKFRTQLARLPEITNGKLPREPLESKVLLYIGAGNARNSKSLVLCVIEIGVNLTLEIAVLLWGINSAVTIAVAFNK